ncbi:MAG: glucose-1-phosphate thymidylyltransferase [Acidimicrobiia bacterium]
MKALVLAGGSGTRLRPITYTSAKQLVPLANKPILFFGLEAIAAAGIKEVGIITGDTHADIEAAVGDGSSLGLEVTYIPQEAPLGLAHTVLIARDFLGDEPFVMYLGDNLVVGGITEFVREFEREQPNAMVLLTRVDEPQHFGVAELAPNGSLVRLVEKPQNPPSDLALVGVYLFDSGIHEAVRAIEPSPRGELEITDAIQWLVEQQRQVRPHVLTEPWIDTGKRQDLLEANRIVLDALEPVNLGTVDAESRVDGRVVIEAGAEIVRSVVRGPIIIGAGTRVVDSYIGPFTSVGSDCLIEDAEVEHSVLLDGVQLVGLRRVADSLIGRNANVVRADFQPRSYRFLISDDSEVRFPN